MFRIGVLGTGSSHVDEFIRHLNDEERFPGLRISTVLAGSAERDARLAALGLEVRQGVADVVAASDGILVTHRDGHRHRSLAEPGLRAGLPTFVDKPLATTLADASGLLRLAREHDAPLGSCSVLQLHPTVLAARQRGASDVVVRGRADLNSPHAGLFFYGIHSAEAACAVALDEGGAASLPEDVRAVVSGQAVTVAARLGERRLRLELDPAAEGFSMDVGYGPLPLDLGPDYLAPVTAAIASVMQGRPAPDPAPTLAAISLLEQTCNLLRLEA